MRKTILKSLAVATAMFIALVIGSASARAQEKTLGFAGGVATYNSGGYIDLYFQCDVAPHIRLAPEIGYIFRNEGKTGFEFSFDLQFPFRLARGFNVYPLTGFTLNSWTPRHGDTYTRVGADFGAGFDIYLTSQLKLSLQGKYSVMNDCSGGFFNMGIGYMF